MISWSDEEPYFLVNRDLGFNLQEGQLGSFSWFSCQNMVWMEEEPMHHDEPNISFILVKTLMRIIIIW